MGLCRAVTNYVSLLQNILLTLTTTLRLAFLFLPEAESPHVLRYFAHGFVGVTGPQCNDHTHVREAVPTRLIYVGDPNPDALRLHCLRKTIG